MLFRLLLSLVFRRRLGFFWLLTVALPAIYPVLPPEARSAVLDLGRRGALVALSVVQGVLARPNDGEHLAGGSPE